MESPLWLLCPTEEHMSHPSSQAMSRAQRTRMVCGRVEHSRGYAITCPIGSLGVCSHTRSQQGSAAWEKHHQGCNDRRRTGHRAPHWNRLGRWWQKCVCFTYPQSPAFIDTVHTWQGAVTESRKMH